LGINEKSVKFFIYVPTICGNALSDMVLHLLQEWGIDKKIFTITLDNASANDRCADLLKQKLNIKKALLCEGEFLHLHCCAHILNLIVQDRLKEIDDAIEKVRDSVKYVRGSQGRKQKFLEAVNQVSLDSHNG
jgi:hypothetical protein